MCVLSVWLFVCACVYTCLYVCGYVCLYVRLWGDHGQSCLELAKVCLINATATGTEILKNLILPGMQAMSDLLTSFLLPPDPVTLFCHVPGIYFVYLLFSYFKQGISVAEWLLSKHAIKKLLSWVHWTVLHEFICAWCIQILESHGIRPRSWKNQPHCCCILDLCAPKPVRWLDPLGERLRRRRSRTFFCMKIWLVR